MKFSAGVRSQTYTLSRHRGKRRDGRRVTETQAYNQTPPDTGQDKCKSAQELFELLERVQSSRLDDQRCVLPAYFSQCACVGYMRDPESEQGWITSVMGVLKWRKSSHDHQAQVVVQSSREERRAAERSDSTSSSSREVLERLLETPGPYPSLVLPPAGYWGDTGEDRRNSQSGPESIPSPEPTYYRHHFLGQEHSNFTGWDEALGPVLLSLKHEPNDEQTRVLLRLRTGTLQTVIPSTNTPPITVAKAVCADLSLMSLEPVLAPRASRLIAAYDEHSIVRHYKFGVLLQKMGQTTEEELFSNRGASPAFEEFLACLGSRINLKYHKGYRGGLDTQFGQTGDEAVYQVHKGAEIIFHVSTLLPFTDNDPQQLQRKRHIGNDIVAIVFQEKNTPFSPDMIASHFLHAFIIVQAIEPNTPNTRYKVSITARDDVPMFGPSLPNPPIFMKGPDLREFLLDKLIAAESACYKAHKFAQLELRTRSSLLESLVTELKEKSREFVGAEEFTSETPKSESGPGSRFIDTVRKALIARVRSQEVKKHEQDTLPQINGNPVSRSSTFGKKSSPSSPVSSPDIHTQRLNSRVSESDCSSLNSVELENNDSDTGLESMSSSENSKPCTLCLDPVADLSQEVTRLKCDKLHLLRQNVTCQREIKRLREKELALQSEIATASREILRLRELLKDYNTDASNI